MTTNKARWRQLHRTLAPIMLLPILLTLITGSLYQIADLADKGDSFSWLIEMHKGHFGNINLEIIYPLLKPGVISASNNWNFHVVSDKPPSTKTLLMLVK